MENTIYVVYNLLIERFTYFYELDMAEKYIKNNPYSLCEEWSSGFWDFKQKRKNVDVHQLQKSM
jgi:hypothetical protein